MEKHVNIEVTVPRLTVMVDGKRVPVGSPEIPEEARAKVAEAVNNYRTELYQASQSMIYYVPSEET